MSAFENKGPQPKRRAIMVSLDSLYDTRLAMMEEMHPALALHALDCGYYDREIDALEPYLSVDKFREAYALRDLNTLELAIPTRAIDIVKNFTFISAKDAVETPYVTGIDIYLNVYPYVMDREQAKGFLEPLFHLGEGKADVHVIRMSDEELTPDHCRQNFDAMLMYDASNWLEVQNENFKNSSMINTTVYLPRLYRTAVPDMTTYPELGLNKEQDLFEITERAMQHVLDLVFVHAEAYSAMIPDECMKELKKKLMKKIVAA